MSFEEGRETCMLHEAQLAAITSKEAQIVLQIDDTWRLGDLNALPPNSTHANMPAVWVGENKQVMTALGDLTTAPEDYRTVVASGLGCNTLSLLCTLEGSSQS